MPDIIESFSDEYEFLSNFYPSPVFIGEEIDSPPDGWKYPTVEHAFQAAKTTSIIQRSRILNAPTPVLARRLGRGVTLRQGWEAGREPWDHALKFKVMTHLILQKFAPGTELAARLMATGDAILIEGNWWGDIYWGALKDRKTGQFTIGENRLGIILQAQRKMLQLGRA